MGKKRKKIIRKPHRIVEVKRKINIGMLVMGLIATIVGCYLGQMIYTHREVRFNGELVSCPIVHIDYGAKGGNAGDVEIDGKKLPIYTLDNYFKVGDSLLVRYDKEKKLVIQEKFQEWNFAIYFALDGVLLISGLILTYGGLARKSWDGV